MIGRLNGSKRNGVARAPRKRTPDGLESEGETQRLVHELEVHRIELVMQNDELRRAQLELEDSRDRYCTLYDQAPVGYLTLDNDGRIVEANLTAAAMLDVERSFLLGQSFASFMDHQDARVFHLHRREVSLNDTKQQCDVWIQRRRGDGFAAHLESVLRAPRDPRHATGLCHTLLFDLSELRTAQEALRTHESRTQTLLDTAADAIICTDDQARVESVNAAAERLFGYEGDELRDRSIRLLIPALPEESLRNSSEASSRETVGVRKDGTLCPLEVTIGEWRDHGGRKLMAIIRDVAERKQVEGRLQESESRFRDIAEHIEDVFYVREPSGVLSYISPACERVWGRPFAELSTSSTAWLDAIHAEDRPRVAEDCARMADGEPVTDTYRIRRPDGSMRWVLNRSYPVLGPDREVLRTVGVVRDVTAERKLEEEVRRSQKMEAVATLAGGMAHNLRNVLQAMLAFIHIAHRRGTRPERAAQALERAVSLAKRGAGLTDQLMLFSRDQEVNPRPLSFDAAVRDACQQVNALVGDAIDLTVDCGAPDAAIMADPTLVQQILLKLAANARDAMPTGGVLAITTTETMLDEATAHAHGVPQGRYVKLVVRDTGSGMTPDIKARIFEPFFTTKGVGKAIGLGLAVVFALTRQASGTIEVESQVAEGTAFTICFPTL